MVMASQKATRSLFAPLLRRVPILYMVLALGLMPACAGAFEILIGTGEPGTFSYFSGRIIARVVSKHAPAITCKTIPSSGDVHNLTNLKQGSLDLALIDSRMLYDAITKKGNFEFLDIRYDNLRGLMPLGDIPLTLVVRSDASIASLDELKGKRINAGIPRTPRHLATRMVMQAKGWEKRDFSLFAEISTSLSQDTMAFCHGTVQAMVHLGVHPAPSVQQLLQRCDAVLLGINDTDIAAMVQSNPALKLTAIEAGTYPEQAQRIETIGSQIILVATEDLDEETAYAIVEALYSNPQRLRDAHPALAMNPMPPHDGKIAGAVLHPGAVLYFSRH
jgi:TRAP transporter TAXI family solute receptor